MSVSTRRCLASVYIKYEPIERIRHSPIALMAWLADSREMLERVEAAVGHCHGSRRDVETAPASQLAQVERDEETVSS